MARSRNTTLKDSSTVLGCAVAELPFRPLAKQHRIFAKVKQRVTLVDTLEQQRAASRAATENLLTALVAELIPLALSTTSQTTSRFDAEDQMPYGA